MAQELIYTSAERGLRPGAHGFCTVAHTQGMMPQTIQLLEALSTYKSAYSLHDEGQGRESPVSWSHCRGNFLGRTTSVLSRISGTVADHTNRSNKIAHHLLVSQREHAQGGPAWIFCQPDLFVSQWSGAPQVLSSPKALPTGDETEWVASTWEQMTGDAGHAGSLATSFLCRPQEITVLVFTPDMPMLQLIREALRLLPAEQRWQVTFNTYFTSLPAGATCAWRCCLADSEELRLLKRNPRVTIMDLTAPLPAPSPSPLVELARQGSSSKRVPEADDSQPAAPKKGVPFKLMHQGRINQITLRPR